MNHLFDEKDYLYSKGFKEGFKEAVKVVREEVAQNLLKNGTNKKIIMEVTGMSFEQIQKL